MRPFAIPLLLAAAVGWAAPAAAQDVSGTWELSWETPRGAQTVLFSFVQDGTALTGSAEMTMGRPGGETRTRTVEISDGTVSEGTISFSLVMGGGPRGGQRSFTMSFSGTVEGEAMAGTVTNPRGGENPFTGKRREG